MKKMILLSALAFGTVATFAQSQKATTPNSAAPVTNLTANAVATPAKSAVVQSQAVTMQDMKKQENEIAKKQVTKAAEVKKGSSNAAGNAAASKNEAAATK